MAASPERKIPPLERVIKVMALLSEAGSVGVAADDLVAVAGYGGAQDGQREQLARDLRELSRNGWRISNIAEPGYPARYRLDHGDPRVRLHFTDAQRQQFARVAALVGIDSDRVGQSVAGDDGAVRVHVTKAPAYTLALATHGHEHRCLLRFTYRDRPRVVASDAIWLHQGRWYVVGREVGPPGEQVTPGAGAADDKTFRVDRMQELRLDRPGSAGDVAGAAEFNVDPLQFGEGDPITAEVEVPPQHRRFVERRLGASSAVVDAGDVVVLRIPVINRTTFRNRLYELGTRVRLVGPADLRAEIRDDLSAHLRNRSGSAAVGSGRSGAERYGDA